MADGATEQLIQYTDTIFHGVDQAWRVQIPSLWRPKAEAKKKKTGNDSDATEAADGQKSEPVKFYLKLSEHEQAGTYLRVLSEREVRRMDEQFDHELTVEPEREAEIEDLRRAAFQGMQQVGLDSAGRVCLSEVTCNAAGIVAGKSVALVGAGKYFEIWNLAKHKVAKAAAEKADAERRAHKIKVAAMKRAAGMKKLESEL
jgi:DNA-binding transcriptional regulator/RsmH inhibitor MraZ